MARAWMMPSRSFIVGQVPDAEVPRLHGGRVGQGDGEAQVARPVAWRNPDLIRS